MCGNRVIAQLLTSASSADVINESKFELKS